MSAPEPVEVYAAWNAHQAHFVRHLLANAGITARVASDAIQGLVGEVPFQKASCAVWVDAQDVDRAREVVAEYEEMVGQDTIPMLPTTGSHCYHCGQPISLGVSPCPECGQELDWSDEPT